MTTNMKRSGAFLALVAVALVAGLLVTTQSLSASAQADRRAMSAANELVDSGHYQEAAAIYQNLLDSGVRDAAVAYNLGNIAMLRGDARSAVTYYRAAAEIAPRDGDIRHNLMLALEQSGGVEPGAASGPLAALAAVTGRVATTNELAILALGAWFLAGFLVIAYRQIGPQRRRPALRTLVAVSLAVALVSVVALVGRSQLVQTTSSSSVAPQAGLTVAAG